MLIEIIWSLSWLEKCSSNSFRKTYSTLLGAHQVAQTSIYTYFPLNDVNAIFLLFMSLKEKSFQSASISDFLYKYLVFFCLRISENLINFFITKVFKLSIIFREVPFLILKSPLLWISFQVLLVRCHFVAF